MESNSPVNPQNSPPTSPTLKTKSCILKLSEKCLGDNSFDLCKFSNKNMCRYCYYLAKKSRILDTSIQRYKKLNQESKETKEELQIKKLEEKIEEIKERKLERQTRELLN